MATYRTRQPPAPQHTAASSSATEKQPELELQLPAFSSPANPEFPGVRDSEKVAGLAQQLLTLHYSMNDGFINSSGECDVLRGIDSIRHIPAIAVHGRADMVCPIATAYDLHQAWPELELQVRSNLLVLHLQRAHHVDSIVVVHQASSHIPLSIVTHCTEHRHTLQEVPFMRQAVPASQVHCSKGNTQPLLVASSLEGTLACSRTLLRNALSAFSLLTVSRECRWCRTPGIQCTTPRSGIASCVPPIA